MPADLQKQFTSVLGRLVEALRQAPERGHKSDKLTREWTEQDSADRPHKPTVKTKREVGR